MTAAEGCADHSGRTGAPERLEPGLYLVATPIGSARDITLRALDILALCDVIAAEDTRTARRLLEIHGIALGDRPLIAYHDHNGPARRPALLAALGEGKSVAYVSEAGTPLVADPGYRLAREAAEAGVRVTAAPGASAVLAALSLSGLPSDRFLFAGFPPTQGGARKDWIATLARIPATLIVFESPKRIQRLLGDLCKGLGSDREAALCRELTKRFEEVRRGSLADLAGSVERDPPRGEIVLVVDRGTQRAATAEDIDAAVRAALTDGSVREAASAVAERLGIPRRDAYRRALALKSEEDGS